MRATKDSGISWLGEYPSDWELKKIKYCLQERVEKNNPVRTTEILSLTAKQGVIPYDQKEGGGNKPKEDVSAYRLAYPGDIVMNSMNILSGSVGLSQYFGCVSPVYYMLRPWKVTEDVRYYNYTFQTTMFQRSLFGLGNGILIKESGNGKLNTIRMRIPMDKFGELFIPVAPIDEQQRIADFLDAKCAEIDALVADIQSQIDTLEQYKRSVITETVTKGLNPDAEMKDSGVQWIGDTPAHWGVIRGKYILRYMQKPVRENDGVITCFRDGEVTLRSNRREDGFTMSDKEIGYQGIDVGDLVVHGMDGFAGAIGISDSRGKASPVLNVLDTDQCKRYIMYYLRSMAYSDVFLALATGIRVRSCDLRWNKLAELSYPVPPLDEQNAIVKHIDSVLSKADAVIADKKAQLATLDEYIKSLIFEYVTGKKEVPCID
jgi:type I restriction enzyme S subunit